MKKLYLVMEMSEIHTGQMGFGHPRRIHLWRRNYIFNTNGYNSEEEAYAAINEAVKTEPWLKYTNLVIIPKLSL